MDELVSVIIPCYNREKLIERCIRSILAQTYKNLEVIVVDDGSTDKTNLIVKSLASEDGRVKYFYKENSGVSDARNLGLDCANGKYVTFVDSDDTLEPEMYSTLMNLMKDNGADISHCSYHRIESDSEKYVGNTGMVTVFEGKEGLRTYLTGKMFTGAVWNKIYDRRVIGNIRFNSNLTINEDVLFNYYVFKNSQKSVFADMCLYNYYVYAAASACINTSAVKSSNDSLAVSKLMIDDNTDSNLNSALLHRYVLSLISVYNSYLFLNSSESEKLKSLRQEIISYAENRAIAGNTLKKVKLIKLNQSLYKVVYGLYDKIRKPNWDV